MKQIGLALFFCLFTASLAFAETGLKPGPLNLPTFGLTDQRPTGLDLGSKFKGLLSSDQLTFQNTAGVSFTSGASSAFSQYYLNTVTYKSKEKPLIIQAQVGLQHDTYGGSSFTASQGNSTRMIVPYLGVMYQPRHNIQIEFQFSNVPAYSYGRGFPY
ncbi:MAG: hypothetical protein O2954_08625 [bacterium]|nr:hypothetical protein [bacterium]